MHHCISVNSTDSFYAQANQGDLLTQATALQTWSCGLSSLQQLCSKQHSMNQILRQQLYLGGLSMNSHLAAVLNDTLDKTL